MRNSCVSHPAGTPMAVYTVSTYAHNALVWVRNGSMRAYIGPMRAYNGPMRAYDGPM